MLINVRQRSTIHYYAKTKEYVLHKESSDAHAKARNPKRVSNEIKEHEEEVVEIFT